ncbi:TonB-dependent receptor [Edaphobacter aggregans]|uniref:TonB-dependent receptor n=1 Tax=Edaphobacter aggregans TaxID=570835 RepID=UPI000A0563E0|nr:TonB-dependent receptor [Edaphobacter aggregans]
MHGMSLRRIVSPLRMIALALISTATMVAQQSGTITGNVADTMGTGIPHSTVVFRNESTSAVTKISGDDTGHFTSPALPEGKYTVEASAANFALTTKKGIAVSADHPAQVAMTLNVGSVTDQITVEANNSNSVAAQYAPMDGLLDARSARTEVNTAFIQNFSSPVADYTELMQMTPGVFSINSNGVGLGDAKMFFRGFSDGLYDITFDGIPWNDTNTPSHHSWAFFPSQWLGGVDFDRSPGTASTVGPTPFGGSVNLLSKDMLDVRNIRGGMSYGSFNTILGDFAFDSGNFGGEKKRNNVLVDVHHMSSDGFQTLNRQQRDAGSLKYQYKFSDTKVLTGFAGVIWLVANTPNIKGPTTAQVAKYGYNYLLQNTDPTQQNYQAYNTYWVPTDFEYVGYKQQLGKGWYLDTKPYTYSYYNAQYYATQPSGGKPINAVNCAPVKGIRPCAMDKLNSYRKYGEITSLSKVSKYGTFRTGMWYEWAATDRYQIPSDPLTHTDDVLPNFHEKFWTNSYQPFAEYEYHATRALTITGGFKWAHYSQDLKQYADNGKTVGNLGGAAFTTHSAGYNSFLPSADANYRIKQNWSVYGQYSTGSVIPPSSVFDVTGAVVSTLPKPTYANSFQTGTVLKLRRATLNGDYYYINFQNVFTASPDPNQPTATQYTQAGNQAAKGFEGEANFYLYKGLSLYANGTVGTTKYVSQTVSGVVNPNYNKWVANTPGNTQGLGLTYQQKYLDFGIFNKRVGSMWNDGTSGGSLIVNGTKFSGITLNQYAPINSFNLTNLFFNVTMRKGSFFDQSKLRLSFNNVFDQRGTTSLTPGVKANVYTPDPSDTLGLLAGRSVTVSFVIGLSPRRE